MVSTAVQAGEAAPSSPDDAMILAVLEDLARRAGARIAEIARTGFATETKADDSVVTIADREAEEIILRGLRARFPGIPVIAEEETAAGVSHSAEADFFLVDPLDGTREFVRGGDDYTVNIALIRRGWPTLGVVYAPARQKLYTGCPGQAEAVRTDGDHRPATRASIAVRPAPPRLTVVASRSHLTPETDAFIRQHDPGELVSVGSSLKFCLLAEGAADLYPRFGRTMQWDTAAGDAVLRAAGGMTRTLDGAALRYGMHTVPGDAAYANPHFIAEGGCPGAGLPKA